MIKYVEWSKIKPWIGLFVATAIYFIIVIIYKFNFESIQMYSHSPYYYEILLYFGIAIVVGVFVAGFIVGNKDNGFWVGFLAALITIIYVIYFEIIEIRDFRRNFIDLLVLSLIYSCISGVIGGVGGSTRQLIDSIAFKRKIQQFRIVLGNLSKRSEDGIIKDNKKLSNIFYFIKNHILILVMITNIIGFSFVISFLLSETFNQQKDNEILIKPQYGEEDSKPQYGEYSQKYNLSEIPFFLNISMHFNYEEPVSEQLNLNFEEICLDVIRNPLHNDYLFSWESVPGNDNNRLKNFLENNLNIDWIDNAKIIKTDDNETINIFLEGNSVEIKLVKQYLFSWDKIPEIESENNNLIIFLESYNISWAKKAKIEKTDDGKTIILSTENNFLSLRLNDEKTKIYLKIDDVRSDDIDVMVDNNNFEIYNKHIKEVELHVSNTYDSYRLQAKEENGKLNIYNLFNSYGTVESIYPRIDDFRLILYSYPTKESQFDVQTIAFYWDSKERGKALKNGCFPYKYNSRLWVNPNGNYLPKDPLEIRYDLGYIVGMKITLMVFFNME